MNYNKTIIVGNLTRNPETRNMPNGTVVCNFAIATNRTWKDKDGNKQQDVEFHNVVVFGKMAETVAQYMKKGNEMLVEGRLKTQSWEDKETGKKMYRTEIVAENFRFGRIRDGATDNSTNQPAPRDDGSQPEQYGEEEININDIPF